MLSSLVAAISKVRFIALMTGRPEKESEQEQSVVKPGATTNIMLSSLAGAITFDSEIN